MTRRRRKSKKWISGIVLILLAAMAGVVCWFVYDNYFREEKRDEEKVEVLPGDEGKNGSEGSSEAGKVSAAPEKKKVEQYEGEDPNASEEITGAVTYAGVSGGVLRIRVNIDQYLSSGSCKLTLVRDGATVYTETVAVVDSAATATCQGFDINTAEISGTGKINISVLISVGERTGTISGEVSL